MSGQKEASALEEMGKLELAELLAQMLAESGGPLTTSEQRAADRKLGIPDRKRRPPRG